MKLKEFIIVFSFIVISCFNNNNKITFSENNITNESDSVVYIEEIFIEEKIDIYFLYKNIFFAGLLGNDSVFIATNIKEDSLMYFEPCVYIGKTMLYQDTSLGVFKIDSSNVKIISINNVKYSFILLTVFDPVGGDEWLVLQVKNNHLTKTGTVRKKILKDIDNDGFLEIGGRELSEAPCFRCDSSYYVPYQIFKLNETFDFDSINSEKLTMMLYDTFLGFEYNDTILHFSMERYNSVLELIE